MPETAKYFVKTLLSATPGAVRHQRLWLFMPTTFSGTWVTRFSFLLLVGFLLMAATACKFSTSDRPADTPPNLERTQSTVLTVFAAASLTEALQVMADAYQLQYPEREVILNFDGSQRLRTQLEHGAQADVFASADWAQMETLESAGLLLGEPVDFAGNRLAFLLNSQFAAGLEDGSNSAAPDSITDALNHLKALARPGVKIVLAQSEVPAGQYSKKLLEQMASSPDFGPAFSAGITSNVVSREANVRSVAQKVALGEADAGITYATDAIPLSVSSRVRIMEIPLPLRVEAHYPVAATSSKGRDSGFIVFLLSDQGQAILEGHGFSRINSLETSTP